MNYIYLILGIVLGVIFIGRGKNARNRKFIPYEVKTKLKTKKTREEYEEWCDRESLGCTLIGIGFATFGLSATFAGSNVIMNIILSVVSLGIFVVGFFMRIINNKRHLGHYFTK